MRQPAVVVEPIHQKLTVVELNAAAQTQGVRVGYSLAEARVLCPGVVHFDRDARADGMALEALGRWLTRFSPQVATGFSRVAEATTAKDELPHATMLLLDITGSERLFGSLHILAEQVGAALRSFSIPHQLAIAPTPAAAWAFSWAGEAPEEVLGLEELPGVLEALPIRAMRLPLAMVKVLESLGLMTIGHLLAMPRETLPSRFGPMLLGQVDRLLGRVVEPLVYLPYDPPMQAMMEFESAIESLETLHLVLKELLGRVLHDLRRRGTGAGHGAKVMQLTCRPDPYTLVPTVKRQVHLSRPSADLTVLFDLLRCATENLDCGDGFVSVHLKVAQHEKLSPDQAMFFGSPGQGSGRDLSYLLDRLALRLGAEAVARPQLRESHLPERAWCSAPHGERPGNKGPIPLIARPLQLLPMPQEIRVVAEPSDDREGRPVQFVWNRTVHRLSEVRGPERISGEWWRSHLKTRDYYDALDEEGRRFWLFRVATRKQNGISVRWFLHGIF